MSAPLPRAAEPFVRFATVLRTNGFLASPEQTQGFLAAIGLLGPRALSDIRRAAHALFGPPPERAGEFDALFDTHFLGRTLAAPATGETEDDTEVREERAGADQILEPEGEIEIGAEASPTETLTVRRFGDSSESAALQRFTRLAPARLPRRLSRRTRPAAKGRIDLRRTLRRALAREGEALELPRKARRPRPRPVLLLIDVSGSMKAGSDGVLRLAHALIQAAARAGGRAEAFTFGTRLTRITPALRLRQPARALERTAGLVADWDGGTRIGAALDAFLGVPRFAGYARGALVVVVSDGLERGDPASMIEASTRLSRLAWRLDWLSPLAADPSFVPRTEALATILPVLDHLGDGSGAPAIAARLLGEA